MTFVFGDTHGYFYDAETCLYRAVKRCGKPEQVIQVGDYGFGTWSGVNAEWHRDRADQSIPIKFIDGNHENFVDLAKYQTKNNIIHLPRSHVEMIEGNKTLFCGGGTSIDKMYRKAGKSWWPEEKITVKNIDDCLLAAEQLAGIDVIVTHECPDKMFNKLPLDGFIENNDALNDRRLLQVLMDQLKPKVWIFGHYHFKYELELEGTKFYCCPMVGPKDFEGSHLKILKWENDDFEWLDLNKR